MTYKPWPATKNLCYHFQNRERKLSFGDANPDKTFYVIRPINDASPFYIGVRHHLLANYFYVISHLKYAHDMGWIPVIDQLNYPVFTSVCGEINGTRNAWEYFWQQPSSYTMDEVYSSKNVVLSKRSWFGQWDIGYDIANYTNQDLIAFYNKIAAGVPIKDEIANHVSETAKELLPASKRVLGVSVRHAGHARNSLFHAPGHPITPDTDALLSIVEQKIIAWEMDYVFLACDDECSYSAFVSAFGAQLLALHKLRRDPTKQYSVDNPPPMYAAHEMYNTAVNYLTEMTLLSMCTGIIGSPTSGVRYAVVHNHNAYENVEIIDSGRFPNTMKLANR